MDDILGQLTDLTGTFALLDVGLVLGLSFVLGLAMGGVYRATHRGVSYSQGFVHTLVLLCTVVALLMLIVGSNIARAFTLVGALSIIRFRNALKETRDVGFIFATMAIGMACGTRFYMLAVFATVWIAGIIVLLSRLRMFAKVVHERILLVEVPGDANADELLAEGFERHAKEANIISLETVRAGELKEAVYSVVLRRGTNPARLLDDVRERNGDRKASLVLGQQELDL
ncbi:MAG: DUF4956 domain-containing protein [Candidatus Riflebacteria bacterium]|nr:DUF4956 domain-containing protein [Candidatus Riflebacteria bacterium]